MKVKLIDQNKLESETLLKDLLSKNEKTILYFYPKDNTPGCSLEANAFSKNKELFNKNGIGVIGVSKDSCKSHINFINKQDLDIDLISDENLELHKKFSVIGKKRMYGKVYEGVIRSTFLLDKEGNVLQEWRNVRAKGHVEKLIRELGIDNK
ncbi:MAG TPA: peroxiredoxin [Candidatus Absconditabacterales bacterium]|nr:peroxiredoxin [Candidatus Absconditabacterales bacterium]